MCGICLVGAGVLNKPLSEAIYWWQGSRHSNSASEGEKTTAPVSGHFISNDILHHVIESSQ